MSTFTIIVLFIATIITVLRMTYAFWKEDMPALVYNGFWLLALVLVAQ